MHHHYIYQVPHCAIIIRAHSATLAFFSSSVRGLISSVDSAKLLCPVCVAWACASTLLLSNFPQLKEEQYTHHRTCIVHSTYPSPSITMPSRLLSSLLGTYTKPVTMQLPQRLSVHLPQCSVPFVVHHRYILACTQHTILLPYIYSVQLCNTWVPPTSASTLL